jgi:hypothetical protein
MQRNGNKYFGSREQQAEEANKTLLELENNAKLVSCFSLL